MEKKFLYHFGEWLFNHRKRVMLGTIIVLIIAIFLGIQVGSKFDSDMAIPGTKSAKASKIMKKDFSSISSSGGQIQIVMNAPKSEKLNSKANIRTINKMLQQIKKDPNVKSIASPEILKNYSKTGKIGYATIVYKQKAENVSETSKNIVKKAIKITKKQKIQTELTGTVTISKMDTGESSEIVGIIIAFFVLAITFGSLLIAGLPIISAIIGLLIGIMGVFGASHYIGVASFNLSLCAMLGLAVGIDYSLFIISRYRQEFIRLNNKKASIAVSMATAGESVIFAGTTVIIALLAMSVLNIPFLTSMAITAMLCVLTAMLTTLFFVPALLTSLNKIGSGERKNRVLLFLTRKEKASKKGWGNFIVKKAALLTIGIIIILSFISVPLLHMNLGLPVDGAKDKTFTERKAYDLQTKAYGIGSHATLVVLVKQTKSQNVQIVAKNLTTKIKNLNNVANVSVPIPSKTNDYFMLSVTPKTDANNKLTKSLVHDIRNLSTKNTPLFITGTTAVNIDISQKLSDAVPIFAALITIFAFVLLMIAFRSLLIPLIAVLGFLLSIGATLGSLVFIIQDGHFLNLFNLSTKSSILNFLPVLVIGILFGLAMDYEVFIVSRIKEEIQKGKENTAAIRVGLKESGGTVFAAAVIMVAVFSGFILADDATVKSMGLALTFGILFDAFIVRLTLVPATIKLFGKAAWYLPKWLNRLIPGGKK